MIKQQLDRFNRLDLLGQPTPLEKLERLSAWLGSDVYIKRDDLTPLAMGATNYANSNTSPPMRSRRAPTR